MSEAYKVIPIDNVPNIELRLPRAPHGGDNGQWIRDENPSMLVYGKDAALFLASRLVDFCPRETITAGTVGVLPCKVVDKKDGITRIEVESHAQENQTEQFLLALKPEFANRWIAQDLPVCQFEANGYRFILVDNPRRRQFPTTLVARLMATNSALDEFTR